jgi:hypothetical protein
MTAIVSIDKHQLLVWQHHRATPATEKLSAARACHFRFDV